MIHVYCGDGKGKTTAAVGLAVRHAGCGGRVLFVQFLKCMPTGELAAFEKLEGITVLRNSRLHGFSNRMDASEKAMVRAMHDENLQKAAEALKTGEYTMVVLDEICAACQLALVNQDAVNALMDGAGATELVLTGRNPSPYMLEKADYITEMKLIRHPYSKGIGARKGVEY